MRVRTLALVALTATLALAPPTRAASDVFSVDKRMRERKQLARLTASVVGSRYCRIPGSANDLLVLRLRLGFENVGSRPLIVPKNEPPVLCLAVARNAAELAEWRYEQKVCNDALIEATRTASIAGDPTPSPDDYAIVPPCERYETECEVSFEVSRAPSRAAAPDRLPSGPSVYSTIVYNGCVYSSGPSRPIDWETDPNAPPPPALPDMPRAPRPAELTDPVATGDHVLIVCVDPWTACEDRDRLATKWNEEGFLVCDPIWTQPCAFSVEHDRVADSCE